MHYLIYILKKTKWCNFRKLHLPLHVLLRCHCFSQSSVEYYFFLQESIKAMDIWRYLAMGVWIRCVQRSVLVCLLLMFNPRCPVVTLVALILLYYRYATWWQLHVCLTSQWLCQNLTRDHSGLIKGTFHFIEEVLLCDQPGWYRKQVVLCMLFSNFGDIFDVTHFINSLRDEVHIVKRLPKRFGPKDSSIILEMPPVSWSDEKYYLHQVCHLIWDPLLLSWYMHYYILVIIVSHLCRSCHY